MQRQGLQAVGQQRDFGDRFGQDSTLQIIAGVGVGYKTGFVGVLAGLRPKHRLVARVCGQNTGW